MSFHVTFEAILRAKGLFTPIAGTKERSLTYSGRNQQTLSIKPKVQVHQ